MKKQKLSIKWEEVLPGMVLPFYGENIHIVPLTLTQLAKTIHQLKGFAKILQKDGVTWDNCKEKESVYKIAVICIEHVPDLLAEWANMEKDDFVNMPLEAVAQIVAAVIHVNNESRESFLKNYDGLMKKATSLLKGLVDEETLKEEEVEDHQSLEKSSKS